MPRLLDHLKSLGLTASEARERLTSGKVFLCGVPAADEGRDVRPEDVTVRPNAPRLKPGRDLALVHVDPHLAVIWKPPGLLSVPAKMRHEEPNVLGVVGRLLGTALPVHRLDEHTSGLMLVARTEPCQERLKELLSAHQIERHYLALVLGSFDPTPQTFQSVLVRDRGDGKRGTGRPAFGEPGKPAVTHARLVELLGTEVSLVEARLETGRTHQVRIHLAEAKHPVLGDTLYAKPRVARAAPRLALHSCHLGLVHPMTAEPLAFNAPLADDLEQLRRWMLRELARGTSPTGTGHKGSTRPPSHRRRRR